MPTPHWHYEITLTDEDRKYATSTLSEPENEEEKKKVVFEIKKWINENANLKGKCDERIITLFLRNSKYQVERAQCKLVNHLELRNGEDNWFKNRDPSDPATLKLLKTGTVLPLHGRDKEGRKVILIRTAAYNPRKNTFLDVFKIAHMIMDLLMKLDEKISVYGIQAILDLSGNSIAHVLQLTPSVVGRAMHAWQNCYPVRTRRIDFFNAPIYANVVIKIFLKFMSEKLKSRVNVYGTNQANLFTIVDSSMLPKEYGGTSCTTQELTDYWISRLIEHRDWFLETEQNTDPKG